MVCPPSLPSHAFTPFKMSATVQEKINNTIDALVAQSREHFEEKMRAYTVQLRAILLEKEREMRFQALDAKFIFNFTVALPYKTEGGPLFPPLPLSVVIPPYPKSKASVPTHDYRLRRSARRPAGFYSE